MIVDASGLVLGRLASVAASRLLKAEEIKIVNVEKAIISGNRDTIFREYKQTRARGDRSYGPYFPRRPDRIMKRTVRGMVPYKTMRGRDALSRLRVYVGIPRDLVGLPLEQPQSAKVKGNNSSNFIELGELSKRLGSKF